MMTDKAQNDMNSKIDNLDVNGVQGQNESCAPCSRPSDYYPPVLDACCGSKMFWFDRQHPDVVFMDNRHETLITDSRQGRRVIVVAPDIMADFTNIPFPSQCFSVVVFDPPHLTRNGRKSWMGKKYGTLKGDWKAELSRGFKECFRVLKAGGVMIFKWNETDIPVSLILKLAAPARPLIGNRNGKTAKSHWIVFLKL